MEKPYRTGAVGAILDEYERAAEELKAVLRPVSLEAYTNLFSPDDPDPNCRSIQTIMNHVVRAGYGYANFVRRLFGAPFDERKEDYGLYSPAVAIQELERMLVYTEATLAPHWELNLDDVMHVKGKTSWGQEYDFEQMMEHAIVHILRHRRQIARVLAG